MVNEPDSISEPYRLLEKSLAYRDRQAQIRVRVVGTFVLAAYAFAAVVYAVKPDQPTKDVNSISCPTKVDCRCP